MECWKRRDGVESGVGVGGRWSSVDMMLMVMIVDRV